MKKIAMVGLMTLMCAGLQAQTDDYKYLNAQSTSGTTTVELSNVQKITFTSDNAVINVVSGENINLPLAELQKITFSTTPTGIDEIPSETEGFGMTDNRIAASENGLMCVYSMKGQLVSVAQVKAGQSVNMSTLPQGTYIVKLGKKVIKITK